MAESIQKAIFDTIDILVDKSISASAFDRTITASVLSCVNALTNEYKLSYQGGTFYALADKNDTYRSNQSVYVLVPEGDFSKQKRIIGVASLTNSDYQITAINANINNYAPVGKQVLSTPLKEMSSFGVSSDKKYCYLTLYDYKDKESALIDVDQEELNNILNIEGANQLLIEGTFSTTLSLKKKKVNAGEYGVFCIIAWDTQGEDFDYVLYNFSSKQMMGNPLSYGSSGVVQNYMFPVEDGKEFDHIESIVFYCKDFVTEDVEVDEDEELETDILLRDLEICVLKEITSKNGEYSLTINTPEGITFSKNSAPGSSISIEANFKKQNLLQEQGIEYFWFIEDPSVQTTDNENYNVYAGTGWRKFLAPSYKNRLPVHLEDCSAYITKFLCVAIAYDSITLKSEFQIYNEAENKIIQITSNSGLSFAHNIGAPELTCTVMDLEGQSLTENYNFVWSKIQQDGNEILLKRNYDEIQVLIDDLKKTDGNQDEIQQLELEQTQVSDGVFINGNKLIYPIKKIVGSTGKERIKCAVLSHIGKFIGSAEVTLVNGQESLPNAYNVVIKNGSQVFQYSESGISPTSERYQEPQEILPLSVALYAPDGTEIENKGVNSFDIMWQFPTDTNNTLIDLNSAVSFDSETGHMNLLVSETCNFSIKEEYDTLARDNQIVCLVTYRGMKISGSTNFLFTKIGEDGTNGTDIVVKIEPMNHKDQIATLFLDAADNVCIFEEEQFLPSRGSNKLIAKLYERGHEVSNNIAPNWTIGKNSPILLEEDGSFLKSDQELDLTRETSSLIAQASFSYNNNDYYANYPIPVVKNHLLNLESQENPSCFVESIGVKNTLRSVLYNKDGRNPIYKKGLGVELLLQGMDIKGFTRIEAEVFGGRAETADTKKIEAAISIEDDIVIEENRVFIPIKPSEHFMSGFNNNFVKVTVKRYDVIEDSEILVSTVFVPIHMSYNLYGLASLNGWDGNKIDVNEEGAYIMAPQIGAGVKNDDNTFTGIVMGRTSEAIQKNGKDTYIDKVGLFGFKDGRQSIFLDANTGKAEFGLSDSDVDNIVSKENVQSEEQKKVNIEQKGGQIILDPNGESKIASWRIGRKSLYNVNGDTSNTDASILGLKQDHHPEGALGSIPHESQGIILSGNPAYVSVKGKSIVENDLLKENFKPLESFEVLMDPSNEDGSVFSIYKHTSKIQDMENFVFSKIEEGENTSFKLSKGDLTIGIYSIDKDEDSAKITLVYRPSSNQSDILPFPKEQTFELEVIKSVGGIPWNYYILSKESIKSSSYRYIFNQKELGSTSYVLGQLTDGEGKNISPSFEQEAVVTSYLNKDGGLNANSLFNDNVHLDLGNVDVSNLNSNLNKGYHRGFNFQIKDDTFFKGFKSNIDEKVYFTFGPSGKEYDSDVVFRGKGFEQQVGEPKTLSNNKIETNLFDFRSGRALLGSFVLDGKNNSEEGNEKVDFSELLEPNEDTYYYYVAKDLNGKTIGRYPLMPSFVEGEKGFILNNEEKDPLYTSSQSLFTYNTTGYNVERDNNQNIIEYYAVGYKEETEITEGEGDSKETTYDLKFYRHSNKKSYFDPETDILKDLNIKESNLSEVTSPWGDYKDNWFYSQGYSYIDNSGNGAAKAYALFNEFVTDKTELNDCRNDQVVFWKMYTRSEHRFFVPNLTLLEKIFIDDEQKANAVICYLDDNNVIKTVPYSEELEIVKDLKITATDATQATYGSFLRLSRQGQYADRLSSSDKTLIISSKKLSLRENGFELTSHDSAKSSQKGSVRLRTLSSGNGTNKLNNWRLAMTEVNETSDDHYRARLANGLQRDKREGIFFSGAKRGNMDPYYRSALFTSSGCIIQDASVKLEIIRSKNGKPKPVDRQAYINSNDGLTLQSLGKSVRVESVGTTLKHSTSSFLSLIGGVSGSFMLASQRGSLESGYEKRNALRVAADAFHICKDNLTNEKLKHYQNLLCGNIYARQQVNITKNLPDVGDNCNTEKGLNAGGKFGANILSCGGTISTNGGELRTCGGKLRLGDGNIAGLNTIEDGFTVSGSIKATDFLL